MDSNSKIISMMGAAIAIFGTFGLLKYKERSDINERVKRRDLKRQRSRMREQ